MLKNQDQPKNKSTSKSDPNASDRKFRIKDEIVEHALGGIDENERDEIKMRECLMKYFDNIGIKLRKLTILDIEENLL